MAYEALTTSSEHYDEPVTARYWYDWFDLEGGPCASAYRLLDGLELVSISTPGGRGST